MTAERPPGRSYPPAGPATVNDHVREIFLVQPDLRALGLDPQLLAEPERLERLLDG
jgi:hypothetical protein